MFARIIKRTASACAFGILLFTSCSKDPDPEKYLSPEILSVKYDIYGRNVVLSCAVSRAALIQDCGFHMQSDTSYANYPSTINKENGIFSFTLPDMKVGTEYIFYAYIRSGRSMLQSEEVKFTIAQQLPKVILYNEDTFYSTKKNILPLRHWVIDNLSGEILASGLCWAMSPDPEINSNSVYKVFDDVPGYGDFSCSLECETPGATIYIKAFAINSVGTAYSDELVYTFPE